ncbi:glycosyltransferase family 4 protein [Candidatus Methylopumilus planktonicus]|uniref:glycosyltransferase family 4 protein n=1 Tax=Candidatus Methylopumilus planktonicus TaxID=1581557 RepID=UPI001121C416|nr:glycosyltransferase family 4 protein [Candidatus Methylopumilus planktonicus]QDD01647.1 glycosyltransferase family 4 protein [Candidatus Methylopumilus planktonicus]
MKIAIIRRKFTAFGGAENFILRASSGLSQLGINFFIISELWKRNSHNSKNIHWIEAKSHGFFRFTKFIRFQKSVRKIIALNNFDLIQSHERLTGVDIYRLGDGIHAAWIDRLKEISPWYKKAWLSIDPYHQKIIRIEKEMSEDENLFYVANSDLIKKELYKYYKVPESRIKVIENGIDTRSFHPASPSKKEASKKQLALNPKFPVVLFVGSGFERKGAFEIVEAIKLLPKFQAIIVGQDKKIDQLRVLAHGHNILVTGPQDNIQKYLDAADIFCLPSLYDSLPNAALEALCCGLPIVLTKDVGLAPHIKKNLAGVICKKDKLSIADALIKAWEKRKLFSKNALKAAKAFEIKNKNKEWFHLYNELLKNKKIKVLHTESSLGWGGQEIRVLTEAKIYSKYGHEVIVAADKTSMIAKRAYLYGVRCDGINLQKKRLADLFSLRKLIKEVRPDVISCHSSTDHWLSALARLTLNIKPAIVRTRHISTHVDRNLSSKWLYNNGCESIMTTSESIKDDLTRDKFVRTPATSVPTGIDTDIFVPGNKLKQRKLLKLPQKHFIFGIAATLRSWKGHSDLIEAFNLLKNPLCTLIIIGDGPQMENCKKLAKNSSYPENIKFIGDLQNIVPYLQGIDCFVLPSYANEGVPQALLQAMSVGLSIISCPVGGIPETLRNYKRAILTKPKSPELLSKAMLKIMKTTNTNQLKNIHRPFTLDIMYKSSLAVYDKAIKSRFEVN